MTADPPETHRRYRLGDRVTVRQATSMFHTRTQAYTRGRTGVVVDYRPAWVIPEDEAWGRDDGRVEPFYVVRFRQTELWPAYTGCAADTLETEVSERWLEPAGDLDPAPQPDPAPHPDPAEEDESR